MDSVSSLPPGMWTIRELVPQSCMEWRSPDASSEDAGTTRAIKTETKPQPDSPRVLHFAPGSWLVIDGDLTVPPSVLPSGLIGVDVTGKWMGFEIHGSLADSVLRTEVQLGIVFAQRHCAAASVFDCPVLLHRNGDRFELWVQASYSDHLRTQLADTAYRLAAQLNSRR